MTRYEDFIVTKLFDIQRGDIKNQFKLGTSKNGVDLVVQNEVNNGFEKVVDSETYRVFQGNQIIIGRQTGVVYYYPNSFVTTDGVLVLTPKSFTINRPSGLYIVSTIKKALINNGYSNTVSVGKLNKMTISLPVDEEDNILWEVMETRILKSESKYFEIVKEYFSSLGIDGTNLTKDDQNVLQEHQNAKFEKFSIPELFEFSNTTNLMSIDIKEKHGKYPYITASNSNNGLQAFINHDVSMLMQGNTIFIGGKTFTVSYQGNDYFSNDSHNLWLKLKNNNYRNKHVQLYLISAIKKGLGWKYSWGNSISKTKIKDDSIMLPVSNLGSNTPNWKLMEKYIKIIEKLNINKLYGKFNEDIRKKV